MPVVLASWLRSASWNRPLGSRTLVGRKQFGSDTNAKEYVQMKTCWIGIVGTGALVISAFGQNSVALQAPAIESVLVTISPDKSSIAAILEAEVALQPGPGCLLRVSEPVTRRLRTSIRLSPRRQLSCPYASRSWHVNPKRSVAAR
jgi:hypothetical protein